MGRRQQGRHRRPQEPRISGPAATSAGAAAVVGIAALGVVSAPPAQAESGTSVWSRVAACESSRRWHVNTGNHYFGGLQFWQPTWAGYGGIKYAPRADVASPIQQIAVARRVLASQGPQAWPVCSKKAKLTKANGGATAAALPNIGPYVHSVPAQHPKPAPKPVHDNPAPRYQRYVVHAGDSLSALAERFHVSGGWQALWHYNRTNVPNPNVIYVGQVLQIP